MKLAKKRSSLVSKRRNSKQKVSKKRISTKRKVNKKKKSSLRKMSKKRRRGSRTSRRSTTQYGAGFDGDLFHITSFAEKEKEKTILQNVTDTAQSAVDSTVQTISAVAGATRDLAVNTYKNTTSYFK